jgi:hypothetical protein
MKMWAMCFDVLWLKIPPQTSMGLIDESIYRLKSFDIEKYLTPRKNWDALMAQWMQPVKLLELHWGGPLQISRPLQSWARCRASRKCGIVAMKHQTLGTGSESADTETKGWAAFFWLNIVNRVNNMISSECPHQMYVGWCRCSGLLWNSAPGQADRRTLSYLIRKMILHCFAGLNYSSVRKRSHVYELRIVEPCGTQWRSKIAMPIHFPSFPIKQRPGVPAMSRSTHWNVWAQCLVNSAGGVKYMKHYSWCLDVPCTSASSSSFMSGKAYYKRKNSLAMNERDALLGDGLLDKTDRWCARLMCSFQASRAKLLKYVETMTSYHHGTLWHAVSLVNWETPRGSESSS